MNWRAIAQLPPEAVRAGTMQFMGFQHGLNTYAPASMIVATEASKLVNWTIRGDGGLVSRPGITQYSNSATTGNSAVKTVTEVNIGGTLYTLLVDASHRLYYLDGSLDPTLIGTLEGAATIISFNGVALIFDGSYIKYLDGVSSIKIAYDDGSGTRAAQHDTTCQTVAASKVKALNSGGNTRVGAKFTTDAWDTGYTIDVTTVSFLIKKGAGSPTGNATVKIYSDDTGPDTLLATSTTTLDVSTLTGGFAEKEFSFATGALSMSPATDYYAMLEYSGGNTASYISVAASTAGAGDMNYYNGGTWLTDGSADCLCKVRPGSPPKGKFGEVWNNRPWVGGDPDNPGKIWYGNLTHLDWSTENGGGYIGISDENVDNYEVGAMAAFYGDLYVFGKEDQPYLVKISGATPSAYTQQSLLQKPWATHKSLVSAVNDLWYATSEGVSSLAGVQEYGDLRVTYASDPITDRFEDYWATSTAVAGYFPAEGQYILAMPSHHRVLICHTKNPTSAPGGQTVRYPWSEYEFYRHDLTDTSSYQWYPVEGGDEQYVTAPGVDEFTPGGDPGIVAQPDFLIMDGVVLMKGTIGSLADHQWDYGDNDSLGFSTVYFRDDSGYPDVSGVEIYTVMVPTCFTSTGSSFVFGATDGYLYKIDQTEEKDLSAVQVRPRLETAYVETPMSDAMFDKFQLYAASGSGGSITASFLTDGDTSTITASQTFTISAIPFSHISFTGWSVLTRLDAVATAGARIYLNGFLLQFRGLAY